jgi:cytochrome c
MSKLVAFAIALVLPLTTLAEERASSADAQKMVVRAVELYKQVGREKALAEFNNPKGEFVFRDIYITAFDFDENCLAHGGNPTRVGKNFLNETDPTGFNWHKWRLKMAREKGKGWVAYKFPNPAKGGKVEQKISYFEVVDGVILTCGAYKD